MGEHAGAALARFVPDGPEESAARDECLMLASDERAWDRDAPVHLTASALILHPPTRRVLLRFHARHGRWMQVGGHGDPGELDPFEIALREAAEESGLVDLAGYPDPDAPALVQVVVVGVPKGRGEPEHRHGDLRYLLATATPELATPEEEGAPLRWCSLPEATALVSEANLRTWLARVDRLLGAAT